MPEFARSSIFRLPRLDPVRIVASMNVSICMLTGSLFLAVMSGVAVAQPSYGAEAYAARQQEEERWRRLSAQMDEMEKTQEVLRKRIAALEDENRTLRADLTKCCGSGVTPEEFQRVTRELSEKLKEVDNQRVQDNKAVIEQVRQAIRDLKPSAPPPSSSNRGLPGPEDPLPGTGEFYTHVIQEGQTISAVVQAFRAQGVNTSIKAVLDANPKVDPNRLKVGQKILIPKPR